MIDVENVAVVVAHPDDIEICCYGTLSRLKKKNAKIHILIVTNGEQGISVDNVNNQISRAVKRGVRINESANAINHFGDIEWGELSDGFIQVDNNTVSVIDSFLKKVEPDLVITHPVFYEYDHQDHYAVGSATINAWQRLPVKSSLWLFEPIVSPRVDFMPNLLVDISEFFEGKIKTLSFHETQSGRLYLEKNWHIHRSKQNVLIASPMEFHTNKIYEAFMMKHLII